MLKHYCYYHGIRDFQIKKSLIGKNAEKKKKSEGYQRTFQKSANRAKWLTANWLLVAKLYCKYPQTGELLTRSKCCGWLLFCHEVPKFGGTKCNYTDGAAFISLLKFDSLKKKSQILKSAACCTPIQYKRLCYRGLLNIAELFLANNF